MVSRRTLLAGLAGAGLAPRSGLAGPPRFESVWSESSHSAVRLIAAEDMAGVEFRLLPGYKTYWRDPGDSGVPPTFDWAGSRNLAGVEVIWPAPFRFMDGGGFSIGYRGAPVLPVRVAPMDAGKPVVLRLKIDYAVCDAMCIPAQGAAELALPKAGGGPHATRIAAALAKAPVRPAPGETPPGGLVLKSVSLIDGPKPALAVEVEAPKVAPGLDLFVEGPRGSFFGRPSIEYPNGQPAQVGALRRRFVSPIEQRARDLPRWPLTLTVISDDGAVEYADTIDAPR